MSSIEANYIQLQRDFGKLQRAHLELHEEHTRLLALVAAADNKDNNVADDAEDGGAGVQGQEQRDADE